MGRDYRLIPILAPNGVFHPKCAYLSGSQGDLLLVGSGNLTFGGFGRNVEVLDVLAPKTHPGAFNDFADFLEALGKRPDLTLPDKAWVSSFADVARRASDSFAAEGSNATARLCHSVERPIVKQIAEICAQCGGAERIIVLSPFHDPDGSALLTLARATECPEISIGLPPDPNHLSTFPFPTGQHWGLRLNAVRPRIEDVNGRPLHAKWIQIKTPTGILTITGSVNATTAALCSTRNIEVAVVRTSVVTQEWEDIPIPHDFERKPFSPGLSAGKVAVHASLVGSGEIRGQIIPSPGVLGLWNLKLERLGKVFADLPVHVDELGQFRITFSGSERLIEAGSVRITIARAQKEGSGWLEMEELLRMPAEQRSVFSAMVRFMTNQATEQDDIALLDYLAISAGRHLGAFKSDKEEISNQRPAEVAGRAGVSIPLDRFTPDDGARPGTPTQFIHEPNVVDILDRWFGQFRRRVLSPGRRRHEARGEQPIDPVRGGAEDEEEASDQQRVLRSFDAFQAGMISTLNQPKISEADKRAGFAIWFDVSTHMLCHRLGDVPGAIVFLRSWLARTSDGLHAAIPPGETERYVFSTAAILAQPSISTETTHDLRILHEALERFCNGDVSRDFAMAALDRDWAGGLAGFILEDDAPDLEKNLDVALNTSTSLDELQTLLNAVHRNEAIPSTSRCFLAPDGNEDELGATFRAVLKRADRSKFLCERRDANFSLSCCHLQFSTAATGNYKARRIVQCGMCKRFNLRLRP